MTAKPF